MRKLYKVTITLFLGVVALAIGLTIALTTGQQAAAQTNATTSAAPPSAATEVKPINKSGEKQKYMDIFNKAFAANLGVSEEKLNAAFEGAMKEATKQMVTDGLITQEEADKISSEAKLGPKAFVPMVNAGKNISKVGVDLVFSDVTLESVAKLFNMPLATLKDKLKAGQSLISLAAAQNVLLPQVKDTMLVSVKSQMAELVKVGKLTQGEADAFITDLPAIIEKVIQSPNVFPDSKVAEFTNPKALLFPSMEEIAKLFGMTKDELWSKLQSISLAELAASKNVDRALVADTILKSFRAQLASAVKAGNITQAAADAVLKNAPEFIDGFIKSQPNPDGSRRTGA